MGPRLVVDPVTYEAASVAVGVEIAGRVSRAGQGVLDGLAGCAAMAGSDPAGRSWAGAYDEAAALALGVTADVVNGCFQLAALLQQTGFNYGRAESFSTPGVVERVADRVVYAGCTVALGSPAGAAGGTSPVPSHWALIEHAVGQVWPGGHQDRLRAAAAAWTAGAVAIGDATLFVQDAVQAISAQSSPEVDAALTACRAMDGHLWDLGATYRALARACHEFAAHIDAAHSEVEHELISLLEWSAGIQLGGLLLAFCSAGLSEAAAQLAQAERIAATAAKVRAIIAHLTELATVLAASISTATTARAIQISRNLQGLLGARISIASAHAVGALPQMAMTAEKVAVTELKVAATSKTSRALEYALKPDPLNHVFDKEAHNLSAFVAAAGGERNAMTKIIDSVGNVPDGIYGKSTELVRQIGNFSIHIRGRMLNGVFKISTAFIRSS